MRRVSLSLPLALGAFAALVVAPAPRSSAGPDDPPKIRTVAPLSALRGTVADVSLEGTNLVPYDEIHCSRAEISVVVQPVPTAYKVVLRLTIPDTASPGPVEISIRTKNGI